MNLKVVEPLRELFKDEARALGRELGLPESVLGRHPFPGPGLAIRLPGEVTPGKLDILRRADGIYLEEIRRAGLYDDIWQAFAVLLPVRTVGVMGDERTYEHVCALRAVTSTDGMTADYYPFDMAFIGNVANRIVNEVKGINRVVYDVTSKPPGTIEWNSRWPAPARIERRKRRHGSGNGRLYRSRQSGQGHRRQHRRGRIRDGGLRHRRGREARTRGRVCRASVAGVAERSSLVFLCLPTIASVEAVVAEICDATAPDDLVVVNTSTASPRCAAAAHARLGGKGIGYADATVSGTPPRTRAAQARLMFSGEPEHLRRLTPVFETFSGKGLRSRFRGGERPAYEARQQLPGPRGTGGFQRGPGLGRERRPEHENDAGGPGGDVRAQYRDRSLLSAGRVDGNLRYRRDDRHRAEGHRDLRRGRRGPTGAGSRWRNPSTGR